MNILYTTIYLFFLIPFCLMSVDIAITIDDYPMPDGNLYSSEKRTEAFLSACDQHQCKAAFFCIGQDCQSEKGKLLLKMLNDHGHFLANHSMTHHHFSNQSYMEFESEIRETEILLTPYLNMRKWFRYPYLDYGNQNICDEQNKKTFKSMEILNQLGYVDGYVTINTFDWHIDRRLQKAQKLGLSIDYQSLKVLYLKLLKEWCVYYINLYQAEFPEKITHSLLLHANDLNALYLQDILLMIKESGWNIVSPEQAFTNIKWRGNVTKCLTLIVNKPATLDCPVIDNLIKSKNIFSQ